MDGADGFFFSDFSLILTQLFDKVQLNQERILKKQTGGYYPLFQPLFSYCYHSVLSDRKLFREISENMKNIIREMLKNGEVIDDMLFRNFFLYLIDKVFSRLEDVESSKIISQSQLIIISGSDYPWNLRRRLDSTGIWLGIKTVLLTMKEGGAAKNRRYFVPIDFFPSISAILSQNSDLIDENCVYAKINTDKFIEIVGQTDEINLKFEYRPISGDEKEVWERVFHQKFTPLRLVIVLSEIMANLIGKNYIEDENWSNMHGSELSSSEFNQNNKYERIKDDIEEVLKEFIRKFEYHIVILRNFKENFLKILDGFVLDEFRSILADGVAHKRDSGSNSFKKDNLEISRFLNTLLMLNKYYLLKDIVVKIFKPVVMFHELLDGIYHKRKFIYGLNYVIASMHFNSEKLPLLKDNVGLVNFWEKELGLEKEKDEYSYERGYFVRGPYLPVDTQFILNSMHFISSELGYPSYITIEHPYRLYNPENGIFWDSYINLNNEDFMDLFIKGDNFDAMRLLMKNYRNNIDCIYSDPPYNTGNSSFLFHDNFSGKSWESLIFRSYSLLNGLLKEDGIIFSSIDENEIMRFNKIMDLIFPRRLNTIIWQKKTQPSYLSKEIIPVTEYIVPVTKSQKKLRLLGDYGNPEKLTEMINIGNKRTIRIIDAKAVHIGDKWCGTLQDGEYGRGKLKIRLLNGPIRVKDGIPEKDLELEGRFKWTQQRIEEELSKGGKIFIKNLNFMRPVMLRHYDNEIIKAPITLLSKKINPLIPTNTDANAELKHIFGNISPFDYNKPVGLIKYLIRSRVYAEKDACILDPFGGAGSTAHAVWLLNDDDGGSRKVIVIEKGAVFDTVLIPRMRRLMYSDVWRNGLPYGDKGLCTAFKYFRMENFISVVRLIAKSLEIGSSKMVPDGSGMIHNIGGSFDGITAMSPYHLDLKGSNMKIKLNRDIFKKPFSNSIEIVEEGVLVKVPYDLPETFNYLIGLNVLRRIFLEDKSGEGGKILILIGKGSDSEKDDILVIWHEFASQADLNTRKQQEIGILKKYVPNYENNFKIYMNFPYFIQTCLKIEDIFEELMFS